jgi:hypothetical protein
MPLFSFTLNAHILGKMPLQTSKDNKLYVPVNEEIYRLNGKYM